MRFHQSSCWNGFHSLLRSKCNQCKCPVSYRNVFVVKNTKFTICHLNDGVRFLSATSALLGQNLQDRHLRRWRMIAAAVHHPQTHPSPQVRAWIWAMSTHFLASTLLTWKDAKFETARRLPIWRTNKNESAPLDDLSNLLFDDNSQHVLDSTLRYTNLYPRGSGWTESWLVDRQTYILASNVRLRPQIASIKTKFRNRINAIEDPDPVRMGIWSSIA